MADESVWPAVAAWPAPSACATPAPPFLTHTHSISHRHPLAVRPILLHPSAVLSPVSSFLMPSDSPAANRDSGPSFFHFESDLHPD